MWDYTLNAPHTAHTTNLVPYIFVQGPGEANPRTLPAGALCDVAPTLLGLLGLPHVEGNDRQASRLTSGASEHASEQLAA